MWYHALNRGNRRVAQLHDAEDYVAFVVSMVDARAGLPVDVLGDCLVHHRFHLILRPKAIGDLGRRVRLLLTAHARRYHRHHGTCGHVWLGRFKAFPI